MYEQQIRRELLQWERNLLKPPGLLEKTAKKVSGKINEKIPEKVHNLITGTVKGIVRTSLFGAEFTPNEKVLHGLSLADRDRKADEVISLYKKIAAAEGAGTGAGGILLGVADFPALIAIKMKMLFQLAHVYGFDTHYESERLFLLYVFQLAFSGQDAKPAIYRTVQNWAERDPLAGLPSADSVDWEQFQQQYRDAIDLRKMLQLIPGIGAIVGAWANYGLLDELGTAAKNSFRLRRLG
ncbi:EcsC family protein [Paenibacillus sp. MBLB4367]|uniref:EcsC family protein n=1 Tax=Paenibacillus sp. MBLB4367 TaxID=3384767 RepID=UPI0039083906